MNEPAWVQHVIWWQVYPLGFVGAYPAEPSPTADEHRLRRIVDWFDHAIALGASGIALGPVFASRTHGYDTTDHYRIDPRLGDDADMDHLIAEAIPQPLDGDDRVTIFGDHIQPMFEKKTAKTASSTITRKID